MSKSHAALCEEAVFGKFVSGKARVAFISYVEYKGNVEGRNKFSILQTLIVSKDFFSRMEKIRGENESGVGAAVEDEIERPSTPSCTHE